VAKQTNISPNPTSAGQPFQTAKTLSFPNNSLIPTGIYGELPPLPPSYAVKTFLCTFANDGHSTQTNQGTKDDGTQRHVTLSASFCREKSGTTEFILQIINGNGYKVKV